MLIFKRFFDDALGWLFENRKTAVNKEDGISSQKLAMICEIWRQKALLDSSVHSRTLQ